MTELPTIRIVSPSGWATINRADFDPAIHKEWTDGQKEEAVSEAAEAEMTAPEMTRDEALTELARPGQEFDAAPVVTQPRRGRPPKSRD